MPTETRTCEIQDIPNGWRAHKEEQGNYGKAHNGAGKLREKTHLNGQQSKNHIRV